MAGISERARALLREALADAEAEIEALAAAAEIPESALLEAAYALGVLHAVAAGVTADYLPVT